MQPRFTTEYDAATLQPVSLERAKELGITAELIGGEENVTKLNWDSPVGKLRKISPFFLKNGKMYAPASSVSDLIGCVVVGGLSYEVRVATMDEYQTGESVIGRIELPDDGELSPPFSLRLPADCCPGSGFDR